MELLDRYAPLLSDEYARFLSYTSFVHNGDNISAASSHKFYAGPVAPNIFSKSSQGTYFHFISIFPEYMWACAEMSTQEL